MGRPTNRSQDLDETIIKAVADGVPLAEVCRTEGVGRTAVYNWLKSDAVFAERFAHARAMGFDAIADDCLAIADCKEEDPASRRVRVETRLKLLAKWDPRRYGEKLDVTSGNEPLRNMSDDVLEERIAAKLKVLGAR